MKIFIKQVHISSSHIKTRVSNNTVCTISMPVLLQAFYFLFFEIKMKVYEMDRNVMKECEPTLKCF